MINILILVHDEKKIEQLKFLVDRFSNTNIFRLFVHVDLNSDIDLFRDALNEDVHFINDRVRCSWGGFGIVEATINLLKFSSKYDHTHAMLLSGQCFPICPTDDFSKKLEQDVDYISCRPSTEIWPQLSCAIRENYYKIEFSSIKKDYVLIPPIFSKYIFTLHGIKQYLKLFSGLLLGKRIIDKPSSIFSGRKINSFEIFGGSQWFTLCRRTVIDLLDYIELNPKVVESFRYALVPDEMFFHSLLMEINTTREEKPIIKPSLTYVDWSSKNVPLPVTFTNETIDELVEFKDDYLIARKIDVSMNLETRKKIELLFFNKFYIKQTESKHSKQ